MPGVEGRFERLELGDYGVDGRLRVERKTLVDFAASIVDGRLFRQAIALAKSGQATLLILEGRGSDLSRVRLPRSALQGALITVSLVLGIPVLRAADGEETARLILYAAGQLRIAAAGAIRRHGRRPLGKRRLQLHILQGLPGIGPLRAGRLLDRFGEVAAVLAAREDDLRQVEGIGEATARRIHWAVHESRMSYSSLQ